METQYVENRWSDETTDEQRCSGTAHTIVTKQCKHCWGAIVGRKVTSSLSFLIVRKADNKEFTVNGKLDRKSKTGFSYQFLNPYFGECGAYKSDKKWISLGSDTSKAKQKATHIVNKAIPLVKPIETKSYKPSPTRREEKYSYSDVVLNPPIKPALLVREGVTTKSIVSTFLKYEDERAKNGEITYTTSQSNKGYAEEIGRFFQDQTPDKITTENITKHIDIIKCQHKRSAQIYATIYERLLLVARAKGLIEFRATNPASDLLAIKHVVQRSRCDEQSFASVQNLYTDKEVVYKLANELGLATKIRKMDLVLMRNKKGCDWEKRVKRYEENKNLGLKRRLKYSDYKKFAPYSYLDDDNQELVVYQLKTSNIIRIPYSHKIGNEYLTVGDVVERIKSVCDKSSDYLLHHTKNIGMAKIGAPIHPNTLSRKFTEKVRNLGFDWLNKTPPTWHELRSLSIRIEDDYRKLGLTAETSHEKSKDNSFSNARHSSSTLSSLVTNSPLATQSTSLAAGHSSNAVTSIYKSCRGIAGSSLKGAMKRVTNSRISATS